ncbi:MAG: methyl-accepting chemotaxis protein, partial [Thiogranum sp.]
MTQQNASLVEEATAASTSMGEQAHDLNEQVSFFTTGENSDIEALPGKQAERRADERPGGAADTGMAEAGQNG